MPVVDEPIEAQAREVTNMISEKSESAWRQRFNERKRTARWNLGRLTRSVKERGKRFYRRHAAFIMSFLIVFCYVAGMVLFFVVYVWLATVSVWLGLVWLFLFLWLMMYISIRADQMSRTKPSRVVYV